MPVLQAGSLEHTTWSIASLTQWKVPFPNDSVGLNLFQEAQLIFASSKHLVLGQSLLGSLACQRVTACCIVNSWEGGVW